MGHTSNCSLACSLGIRHYITANSLDGSYYSLLTRSTVNNSNDLLFSNLRGELKKKKISSHIHCTHAGDY